MQTVQFQALQLSYLKIAELWYGLRYFARYGLFGLARLESTDELHFTGGSVEDLRQKIELA